MRLPAHLLRHTLIVEPFLGQSGTGPVYGPPAPLRCHLESARESQRRGNDRGPGDSTLGIAQLDDADRLTLDARITHDDGRPVELRSVRRRTFPRSPAPEHVEFTLT